MVMLYTLFSSDKYFIHLKGMATHSSVFAWRIPWTEEPGGLYSPLSHKESDMADWLTLTYSFEWLDLYI